MKKTFELTDSKIKPARKVDAVRAEINKYLKREKRKTLPEEFDFVDFICSFGDTAELKKDIHVSEISKCIDDSVKREQASFYIEIQAEPRKRNPKPKKESIATDTPTDPNPSTDEAATS